jgi:hypothetical protein
LKKETLENILGQWKYAGQVLLKIRKSRKYSWPVGVCGRDTFKNKSAQKLFLASGNMLDRYF